MAFAQATTAICLALAYPFAFALSRSRFRRRLLILVHIMLPATLPGIIAGSILVFLPTLGLFYIPDLPGGAKSMPVVYSFNSAKYGTAWRGATFNMMRLRRFFRHRYPEKTGFWL